MKFVRNTPLKICLQLKDRALPTNTRIGEYVCLPPHVADEQGRIGNVAVISKVVRLSDIKAAKGWRNLIGRNAKLRELSEAEEKKLNKQLEQFAPPVSTAVQDELVYAEDAQTKE